MLHLLKMCSNRILHGDDGLSVVADDPSMQQPVMQYKGVCSDIDSLHTPLRDILHYPL